MNSYKKYVFRIYPSKSQEKELIHHLSLAKNLWNFLLAKTKEKYTQEKKFYTKSELRLMVKHSGLYGQSAQAVAHNLYHAIEAKIRANKLGKKWGFPRFKSVDKVKSILYTQYPQHGFSINTKLNVSHFGEINIVKHREMNGKIKTLCLKRVPSGKWFAIFSVETTPEVSKRNEGPAVGLDLGLNTLATLSNGVKIKNPHPFRKLQPLVARAQRIMDKRKKGSKNRWKARKKLALIYEKISNIRKDYLHKEANSLLSSYSKIAMEELDIPSMTSTGHGKGINDASWGLFTNMLCYKAASAGSEIVFVNPKDTTKECSQCHVLVNKTLWERQHNCPSCGLSIDRDLNAAINILHRAEMHNKATAGIAERYACGETPSTHSELSEHDVSRKQEAYPKGHFTTID